MKKKKSNRLFNSLFGVTSRILMNQNFPTTFHAVILILTFFFMSEGDIILIK